MRHNQNGRMRGRRVNNGGHNNHSSSNQGQQRRGNPRVQSFDSNGPDVRIRGNAFQINEKYLALARDAAAAGDRVLAESYYQHAEHYQRFINETSTPEDHHNHNRQSQPQPQHQPQPQSGNHMADGQEDAADGSLEDLDQAFLVGTRSNGAESQPSEQPHTSSRRKETEAV